MPAAKSIEYIPPASEELQALAGAELARAALGKTKKAEAARDEIVRRFVNKHLAKEGT